MMKISDNHYFHQKRLTWKSSNKRHSPYIRSWFVILCVICSVACNDRKSGSDEVNYQDQASKYHESVRYLLTVHNKLFDDADTANIAVSLYKEQIDTMDCNELSLLFRQQPLMLVRVERDSTILFVYKPSGGIKNIQKMLMYCVDLEDVTQKVHDNVTVTAEYYMDWYEMEKVITLAD